MPTQPAIGNSGRLLEEFGLILCGDGADMMAEAARWKSLPGELGCLAIPGRRTGPQGLAVSRNGAGGSGPFVAELLQDLAEEPFHSIPDPGLLSLAVASHVQRSDLVLNDPRCDV